MILAAHGRTQIVDSKAFEAHQLILAKRVRQPRPPYIQAQLRQARDLKARLATKPGLTREALARETGINPAQFTRLLRLPDLAPEIQGHILALPLSIHRCPVTERRLRPIAKIPDHRKQLARFQELLHQPIRTHKASSILISASPAQPSAHPSA